ncbi:hypothetical protein FORC37_3816 [Vibrio vulnificus]|uniref:Uncharacterized protein n=1 Tax=Vibrio vulnificus TaxID=672 RepID=A0AAN1PSR0_VIBVL|nr:hypothetical protein FORC17_3960 [Vibrio vulnificus]ASC59510.1 hypothetical protein FORC37_3816 [Vibrio vulnificus]AXX62283.1 hypothetical protein FORC53_3944 [Vibrio vulnificus]BDP33185.1 hypothetical protein VV208B2_42650 [Vibrio vulnificus]
MQRGGDRQGIEVIAIDISEIDAEFVDGGFKSHGFSYLSLAIKIASTMAGYRKNVQSN